MENVEELLVSIGLTATEARIYLAGLDQEMVTVQDLVKRTGIKRPTVYHAIGTLLEKGLVSEKKVNFKMGHKSHFSMCAPEHIRGFVERQKELIEEKAKRLDDAIPALVRQKEAGRQEGISVVQYSGIEGMKTVMDIAFYCRSRHWDILAPLQNFLREYDKDYAKRYLHARKYHGITARTLWERPMPESRRLSQEEIKERGPRFMPAAMQGKFKSMMILFDDKVAIFSSYDSLSALLITSKELHAMFLSMFEELWGASEQYK